jgi:hypothetical protein
MNDSSQNTQSLPGADGSQPPETSQPAARAPHSERQRRGKVARLPKAVRDILNVMILDGVPYAEILTALGDSAKGVTEHNITSWVQGGYQDWLIEQQRLAETRVKQEVAMDLACEGGGSRIHEATLQLAATTISEMVRKLNCVDFEELLRDDPAQLIPFLNALARISDSELRCERHRLELEERRAKLEKNQPPAKSAGLRPETRERMEKELKLM